MTFRNFHLGTIQFSENSPNLNCMGFKKGDLKVFGYKFKYLNMRQLSQKHIVHKLKRFLKSFKKEGFGLCIYYFFCKFFNFLLFF